MPYVNHTVRAFYKEELDEIIRKLSTVNFPVGDMNYIVSKIAKAAFLAKPEYTNANNIDGMLSCAEKEYYRRYLAPLEDKKIIENGDI